MAQCPVSWDYTAFQIALHESKLASGAWNSNNKPLESGDVISVDCGAFKTDTTVIMRILEIGEVAPETKKLLQVTRNLLYVGIREPV
jgi:methionine aminopeptidase